MPINKQLALVEREVIAFAVSKGILYGSLGMVEWEVELDGNYKIREIGEAIKERQLEGDGWELTWKRYDRVEELVSC